MITQNTKKSFLHIHSPFSPRFLNSCPLSVLYYPFPLHSHFILVLQVAMYLMFTISPYAVTSLVRMVV